MNPINSKVVNSIESVWATAWGDSRKAVHCIEAMTYDMYKIILNTIPIIDTQYLSPLRRGAGSGDGRGDRASVTYMLKMEFRR